MTIRSIPESNFAACLRAALLFATTDHHLPHLSGVYFEEHAMLGLCLVATDGRALIRCVLCEGSADVALGSLVSVKHARSMLAMLTARKKRSERIATVEVKHGRIDFVFDGAELKMRSDVEFPNYHNAMRSVSVGDAVTTKGLNPKCLAKVGRAMKGPLKMEVGSEYGPVVLNGKVNGTCDAMAVIMPMRI